MSLVKRCGSQGAQRAMPTPLLPRPCCDAGAEPMKVQPSSCSTSVPTRHVSCRNVAKARRRCSTAMSSVRLVAVLIPRQFCEISDR
eukprot:4290793-Prymnesium_polylepis.1